MKRKQPFKVYDSYGNWIADVVSPFFGAVVISAMEQGTIQFGHRNSRRVLWTEGVDGNASESYDHVSKICHERLWGVAANVDRLQEHLSGPAPRCTVCERAMDADEAANALEYGSGRCPVCRLHGYTHK